MSSPVYVMTHGQTADTTDSGAHGERRGAASRFVAARRQPCLTVASSLFGGGFEVEGLHQVESGIAEGQALDSGPQVDDVSLLGAVGVVAAKDVVAEVHAEALTAAVAAMER